MSNGSRLMMTQGLRIIQCVNLHLAPLITPVLRRSREQRPVHEDDNDTPWRMPAPSPGDHDALASQDEAAALTSR